MNCPNCQTANPDNAKFCLNCGSSLESVRPVIGERRLVTVLFADVVGSTAMAEQLDPEQVTEIMNGAFSFMNDAVGRYDGTVARLMGDAIMAFFGAPIAHENDAERAIRAGLEMQAAAKDYARMIQSDYGLEFDIRVGINTGLVVVATVGDELRSEHTVMGDTVNVAARLQQVGDPGAVLISADTLRLTHHLVEVESRGAIELKGKSEAVETYEVVGIQRVPGQGRGLEGITSPIVGRSDEIQTLHQQIDALRAGRGSAASIIGEAGLGKSRLIAELRKATTGPDRSQISWLEGRALSYGPATPYSPWQDLLRSAIGVTGAESPDAIRELLHDAVSTYQLPEHHQQFLEVILAIESSDVSEQVVEFDGDELRNGIRSAVREFIIAMAERHALIIVFDDLHWADPGSIDLLFEVADLVHEHPLLLITVLRPDKGSPSWSFVDQMPDRLAERQTQVWLEPLDSANSSELLGNLLHIEDLPASVRNLILAKSEGNPFFLEEVIRTLIDSGHIVRHDGHWRATKDIVNVTVPDTLVGVLSARIDRLSDETKRVAQIAATIGRIFTYSILKAVCEQGSESERIEDPAPHLETLSYEELVRERSRQPDLEYIFKHVLTQEAAYNLLLVRTRREYHRRVGLVLEEVYADRRDEMAATLAHHFWNGEDWNRALEYSLKAGERAEKHFFAMREAHDHFERAYETLARISDPTADLYPEVVVAGMNAALKFLPREELLDRLHRAEAITRENGDKRRLSQVLHWVAHIHALSGFVSRAMPALNENYKLSEELGDQRLSLYPSWAMAFQMLNVDPRTAAERLRDVAQRARQYKNRHLEVHGFGSAAIGHARLGEFAAARAFLEEARIAASQTDEPVTSADFHLLASFAYLEMGEYERSLEHGRMGIDEALAANAMECAAEGYCAIGMGELQGRRADRALNTFQESFQYAEQFRGDVHVMNRLEAGMAIARYVTGETQDVDELKAALATSETLGDKYTVAELSRSLASAYLDKGQIDLAEQYLSAALDYYRTYGMQPHLVRTLDVQARLFDAKGASREAAETRAEIAHLADGLEALAARSSGESPGGASPASGRAD